MPNIPNPPSPYIKDLSGRIVLDVWGGRYADIAKKLEALADYGIERLYRDVRLFRIYEGTSQIQQIIIARETMKRGG